jgi:hypothetical protein
VLSPQHQKLRPFIRRARDQLNALSISTSTAHSPQPKSFFPPAPKKQSLTHVLVGLLPPLLKKKIAAPLAIVYSKPRAGGTGTGTAGAAVHPKTTDPTSWEVEVPW